MKNSSLILIFFALLAGCTSDESMNTNGESKNDEPGKTTEYRVFIEDGGNYPPWINRYAIKGFGAGVTYSEEEFFSIRTRLVQFCKGLGKRAVYDKGFFIDEYVNNLRLNNYVRSMNCFNYGLQHPQDIYFTLSYQRFSNLLTYVIYKSGFLNETEYLQVKGQFKEKFVTGMNKEFFLAEEAELVNPARGRAD